MRGWGLGEGSWLVQGALPSVGTSRVSWASEAPTPVMAGGTQPELPWPTGAPPPSALVQAARLCLSHQVQVIHVAAALGLPVGMSASPGYHDNRMQGTRASVGCGSWRGSAMGKGGALFPPPVGSLARAGASGGWLAPPCLCALAFPSCHLCWELGGGARVPSPVGGVWEQMGGRNSPSHLGYTCTTLRF